MRSEGDTKAALINPFYAVTIHPDLEGEHEPIITKQRWIQANARLIDEMGVDQWLRQLLAVLEGNFPRSTDCSERIERGSLDA
jgi:hypothetical protein